MTLLTLLFELTTRCQDQILSGAPLKDSKDQKIVGTAYELNYKTM